MMFLRAPPGPPSLHFSGLRRVLGEMLVHLDVAKVGRDWVGKTGVS